MERSIWQVRKTIDDGVVMWGYPLTRALFALQQQFCLWKCVIQFSVMFPRERAHRQRQKQNNKRVILRRVSGEIKLTCVSQWIFFSSVQLSCAIMDHTTIQGIAEQIQTKSAKNLPYEYLWVRYIESIVCCIYSNCRVYSERNDLLKLRRGGAKTLPILSSLPHTSEKAAIPTYLYTLQLVSQKN